MKYILITLLLTACTQVPFPLERQAKAALTVAPPSHVFVVWFENKGYTQVVGSTAAPYINSLIQKGTLFTNAYGVTHPSYPNYIAWFSGSTQGITNDNCINVSSNTHTTLFDALKKVGVSSAWYSESMPSNGYTGCSSGYYREKHNPTTIFKTTYTSTYNKVFTTSLFNDTTKYATLPQLVVITPNMRSDMHDTNVSYGDTWLKNTLSKLIDWCGRNNAVFIITFDEDSKLENNRIPMIAIGAGVGQNASQCNHYSVTKSILKLYGADTTLLGTNVKNAKPLTIK